jgi:hypothetical protein
MEPNAVIRQAALVAVDTELASNQKEADYCETVVARGGADAAEFRSRLARLENERGDLLEQREKLIDMRSPA